MRLDARHTLVVDGLEVVVAVHLHFAGVVGIDLGGEAAAHIKRYGGVALLAKVVGRVEGILYGARLELGKAPALSTAKRLVGLDIDAVESLQEQFGAVQLLLGGTHILLCKGLLQRDGEGVAAIVDHGSGGNFLYRIVFALKAVAVYLVGVQRHCECIDVNILRKLFLAVGIGLRRELDQLQFGALIHGILAPGHGVGRGHRSGKLGSGLAVETVVQIAQNHICGAGLQAVRHFHTHGNIKRDGLYLEVAVRRDIGRAQGLIDRDATAN